MAEEAFLKCESLNCLKLPKKMNQIPLSAVESTSWYKRKTRNYKGWFIFNGSLLGYFGNGDEDRLCIPTNVFFIEGNVFHNVDNVKIIENGNEHMWLHIGRKAFHNLSNLESVNFHYKGSISIGEIKKDDGGEEYYECDFMVKPWTTFDAPFAMCKKLREIKIGGGSISIFPFAFSNSNIRKINIVGNEIDFTRNNHFSKCDKLKTITISCDFDPDTDLPDLGFLENLQEITIDGSGCIINSMLYGCKSLKKITVVNNFYASENSENLFSNCPAMESFVIKGDVDCFIENQFAGATSLKEIIVYGNVDTMSNYAFLGCKKLEKIIIKGSVNKMGTLLTQGCCNLKEFEINGVKHI